MTRYEKTDHFEKSAKIAFMSPFDMKFNREYYVIVIAKVPGIYSSKWTESEGKARGQGLFTAINPRQPVL